MRICEFYWGHYKFCNYKDNCEFNYDKKGKKCNSDHYVHNMVEADCTSLIDYLLNNDLENVILFGHNEAITNFVNKFGDIFIKNVPTSGLVWIKFDCLEWKLLKKGKTQKVVFPRDLKYE